MRGDEVRDDGIVGRDQQCSRARLCFGAQLLRKRDVLHAHCADVGRDPSEIRTAVNLGLAWTEDSLQQQFGGLADYVRPGVLMGSEKEVLDRLARYVDAGADQVNLALRAPFELPRGRRSGIASCGRARQTRE